MYPVKDILSHIIIRRHTSFLIIFEIPALQLDLFHSSCTSVVQGRVENVYSAQLDSTVYICSLMHVMAGDTEDLEPALNKTSRRHVTGSGSCSALIKLLPGFSDLYVSHDTWSTYQSMLRILKRYKLHLHYTNDTSAALVPGNDVSFSGYPGIIWSGDDFYTISSGLVSFTSRFS